MVNATSLYDTVLDSSIYIMIVKTVEGSASDKVFVTHYIEEKVPQAPKADAKIVEAVVKHNSRDPNYTDQPGTEIIF